MDAFPRFFQDADPLAVPDKPSRGQAVKMLHRIASSAARAPPVERSILAQERCVTRLIQGIGLAGSAPDMLSAAATLHPGQVASVAWSLAALGGGNLFQDQMTALCRGALSPDGEPGIVAALSPAQCADLVWALGAARHWDGCLSRIAGRLAGSGRGLGALGPGGLKPSKLTSLLWGFAALDSPPHALLRLLPEGWEGVCGTGLAGFTVRQLASLAWSLAVMELERSPQGDALWRELVARGASEMEGAGDRACNQVWQFVACRQLAAHGPEAEGWFTAGLDAEEAGVAEVAARAWKAGPGGAKTRTQPSRYQEHVVHALIREGMTDFKEEDVSIGLSVDVAVPSLRVAIEVDGPTHLARTTGRPLGHTALKRRMIGLLGWTPLPVTGQELDEHSTTPERAALILRKMEAAGVSRV
ncbi:unnamed protein product [Pedinophyceae sp. YPF-701]|nr:unnamed protein product [Pedinophyceae sp. YPF-701]